MKHKGEIKQKFSNLAYQKIMFCFDYCRKLTLTLQHGNTGLIKCVGILLLKALNIISVTECLAQYLYLYQNTLT